MMDDEEFLRQLVARFPRIAPLLEAHRAANFGEVYSHRFMEELTRHATHVMREDPGFVRQLFEHFERTFVQLGRPTPETAGLRELLSVTFIEELPRPEEISEELYEALGPALRAEYDEWHRWLKSGPFPHP